MIAKYLKIPLDSFIRDFVVLTRGRTRYTDSVGHDFTNAIGHIKSIGPCPFHRSGLCAINDVKPQACAEAKPVHIDPRISCADWFKTRWGGATKATTIKEIVIHAPTANAGFS